MTDPLFYTAGVTGASTDQLVSLDAASSGHAIRSQRLTTQDPILLSDGNGTLAHGIIETADTQHTTVRVNTVTVQPPPAVRINLVQALAKGDRDLMAIEMATEIGVDSVTPWQAQRSIVRIRGDRAAKHRAKWQTKLQAAAQQSRRARIPELFDSVVAEHIATLHQPAQGHQVMVLHEDGQDTIADVTANLTNIHTVHIVVGPEGGVAPDELTAVRSAGGTAVKIGPNVMRASTAGPVAIAVLNQLMKRW